MDTYIDRVLIVGLCEGEPTDVEIQEWIRLDEDLSDHLAIRPMCTTCGSERTRWVRQHWHICYNCMSSFTNLYNDKEDRDFWELFEK